MWVNTAFASQAHLGKKCIPDLDCEIGWNWIQTQLGFGMCLVPASLANVKSVGFFLRVCFSLQLLPPLPASWRTILATGSSHFAGGDFPMIKYSSTLSIESSWRCIVLRRRAAKNIDTRGKTPKDKNGWSYGDKLVIHFDKNSVVEKCIRCGFEFKYTHKWSGLTWQSWNI